MAVQRVEFRMPGPKVVRLEAWVTSLKHSLSRRAERVPVLGLLGEKLGGGPA